MPVEIFLWGHKKKLVKYNWILPFFGWLKLTLLIFLTGSAVSTAPKELREVDLNAKMSKSKKKKLKKRAKRNQALMEETMQHIEEQEHDSREQQEVVQQEPAKQVNGGSGADREAAPISTNSTTKLAGEFFVLFWRPPS